MKGYRDSYEGEYPLEEVLWWKIDDDHYQTLIVYPSEEMENPERKKLKEARNNSTIDNNNVLVEEFVEPIVMQETALQLWDTDVNLKKEHSLTLRLLLLVVFLFVTSWNSYILIGERNKLEVKIKRVITHEVTIRKI